MILSLKLSVKALKLPSTKTQKAEFKNNASALNNKVFVDSAIKELITSQCVTEVEPEMHVISPLSVQQTAVVKKRFILDLLYVNKHLWKQSYSLKIGKHFRTMSV